MSRPGGMGKRHDAARAAHAGHARQRRRRGGAWPWRPGGARRGAAAALRRRRFAGGHGGAGGCGAGGVWNRVAIERRVVAVQCHAMHGAPRHNARCSREDAPGRALAASGYPPPGGGCGEVERRVWGFLGAALISSREDSFCGALAGGRYYTCLTGPGGGQANVGAARREAWQGQPCVAWHCKAAMLRTPCA